MVAPLPDEASAHGRLGVDQLEVVLEIPRPIAHGVAILQEQEGLAGVLIEVLADI